MHEVKSRYLPPLNDDLAREEGDFETLLELRIDVRQRLTKAAQKEADAEYVDQLFDMILEGATVVYPPESILSRASISKIAASFFTSWLRVCFFGVFFEEIG